MIIIDIFRKNNRKNDEKKDLKRINIDKNKKRNNNNKKYIDNKGSDFGSQSGFYKLPKDKQNTIMSIISALEKAN